MTHKKQIVTDLPILNFVDYLNPATQQAFLAKLKVLAKEIGFFYLIGHGISHTRIIEIKDISKQFFALPQAKKEEIGMIHSRHFRGYTHAFSEKTRNINDNREQIDIGLDLDPYPIIPPEKPWLNLQGPNQWPELTDFKKIITNWQQDLRNIAIELTKAFLKALELAENSLDDFIFGSKNELLKLIHYPGSNDPTKTQGVGDHKDSDILTLLLQDEVGGLEVLNRQGQWLEAPFLEDAFIVNIGEVLELATNGYLVANIHRVISPPAGVDRYSIAYFITPNLDAGEIPILPLKPELQALAHGPESDPLNPLLQNAGANTLKGRLRSHPDVTQKYTLNLVSK